MIDPNSTFFCRSSSVATAFLQSAVIVDDHISYGSQGESIDDELAVEEMVLGNEDANAVIDGSTEIPSPPENPIDGKLLVDAFAKKGIICGLIQPGKEQLGDLSEDLRSVLVTADVVIVDWFLHSDTECAQAVVADLVKDAISSEPNKLRYIVIYSGNPKLGSVAEQLGNRLKNDISDVEISINLFEIACGSCRIVVLAKEGTLGGADLGERVISEEKLAEWIVSDFAQEYCGLISNVALEAISAVRRNAHRILGRMTRRLDGAFLTHRAFSPEPNDAQYDLRRIISEELEAVLEDEGISDQAGLPAIREWLEAGGMPEDEQLEAHFGEEQIPVPIPTADDLVRMLSDGVDAYIKACVDLPRRSKAQHKPEVTNLSSVLGCEESLDYPDERFAALCTLKPRYTDKPPVLTLGTIVKRKTRKGFEYLVCVQPRCDALLRDVKSRAFLFLPLEPEGAHGFCTVVPDGERFQRLLRSRSPYDLRVFEFEPSTASDAMIKARKDGSGFYFKSVGFRKRELRWCGQLKDSHAQNVAQRASSRMARVGLDTSAWLHRSTGKQVRDQ